jgi:choline transport protein
MSRLNKTPISDPANVHSDYCIAAFAVIVIISVFQWFIDGRKNYTGPRIDMTMDGLDTMPTHESEPTYHEK